MLNRGFLRSGNRPIEQTIQSSHETTKEAVTVFSLKPDAVAEYCVEAVPVAALLITFRWYMIKKSLFYWLHPRNSRELFAKFGNQKTPGLDGIPKHCSDV